MDSPQKVMPRNFEQATHTQKLTSADVLDGIGKEKSVDSSSDSEQNDNEDWPEITSDDEEFVISEPEITNDEIQNDVIPNDEIPNNETPNDEIPYDENESKTPPNTFMEQIVAHEAKLENDWNEWECTRCTLLNTDSELCRMCAAPKPIEPTEPTEPTGATGKAEPAESRTWECKACTLLNTDCSSCVACDTARPFGLTGPNGDHGNLIEATAALEFFKNNSSRRGYSNEPESFGRAAFFGNISGEVGVTCKLCSQGPWPMSSSNHGCPHTDSFGSWQGEHENYDDDSSSSNSSSIPQLASSSSSSALRSPQHSSYDKYDGGTSSTSTGVAPLDFASFLVDTPTNSPSGDQTHSPSGDLSHSISGGSSLSGGSPSSSSSASHDPPHSSDDDSPSKRVKFSKEEA